MNLRELKISPSVRLSFGLTMFTVSVLLIADVIGLIPKREQLLMETHKNMSEALAVHLSVSATRQDSQLMEQTLSSFVEHNRSVSAASLTRASGLVVAQSGVFNEQIDSNKSTLNHVIVPIYEGNIHWGSVNVEFDESYRGTFIERIRDSIYSAVIFIVISCYIGYFLILRRSLRVLDPSSVVPERVKQAFNTMSEGVLIVDMKQQIIMANEEVAKKIDKDADSLIGMKISSLNWKLLNEEDDTFPWITALEQNKKLVDVSMSISTLNHGVRSLSVNCTPISDDESTARGVLVTVDDITDVQETNLQLEKVVDDLVEHQNEITRKNVELETLATRDTLTGCYNRGAFFDRFELALTDAINDGAPLACIMADIDHFKTVNDTFGHAVGDEVIQMFADVLNSYQRDNTIIGRYGGEEFCIVLKDTNIDDARLVAERLRIGIQAASRQTQDDRLHITASFGVSQLDEDARTCSQIIEHADQALYVSKENGRNRVTKWGSPAQVRKNRADKATEAGNIERDHHRIESLRATITELENKLRKHKENNEDDGMTDPISGLPAKALFIDRLNQAIAMSGRMNTITVVTVVNIDMFSRINTAMGEEIGNEYLRKVGNRLQSIIRRSDTVGTLIAPGHGTPSLSRLRGDEFALIFSGVKEIDSISYIINRLQNRLQGKIKVFDSTFFLNTTIGVSLYPNDGQCATELIDRARYAQKHTKLEEGASIQFYTREVNEKVIEQMQLEVDLHRAIENDELHMVYQPKLDMHTGEVINAEALVRWTHPEKGLVSPMTFVPIAEKSGMIVSLGRWIMNEVCRQTGVWVEMGMEDIRVSINVSAIEFARDDFVDSVKHCLERHKLSARHIDIELTESAVLNDIKRVAGKFEELRYLGITLTLDDFGTGYSSFSHLGKLDFDVVKLDRSFMLEALSSEKSKLLYTSLVQMIRQSDQRVVSEGIETQEQFDFVRALDVDEVQGYIVSKPLVAADIDKMVLGSSSHKDAAAGL